MKKKLLRWFCLILAAAAAAVIWYNIPVRLLKTDEISAINVYDGNRGTEFTLTDPDDIAYIVNAFKDVRFKRDGTAFILGTSFHLKFYSDKDWPTARFILMSRGGFIKKDAFFYNPVYRDEIFDEVYDYLTQLSEAERSRIETGSD